MAAMKEVLLQVPCARILTRLLDLVSGGIIRPGKIQYPAGQVPENSRGRLEITKLHVAPWTAELSWAEKGYIWQIAMK